MSKDHCNGSSVPFSQHEASKITFVSLRKEKIGTFWAAVSRQPVCFLCLPFCLLVCLKICGVYVCMFFFYLSICFPVYLFLKSPFLFIRSVLVSIPAPFLDLRSLKCIFTRWFCFSWRNLETIPDMPACMQPGGHLLTGGRLNRISGLCVWMSVYVRRWIVRFFCF